MYMVDQNADDARKLLQQWHSVFAYVTQRAKELTDLGLVTGPMHKNGKKTYCILRGSTLSHYEAEPSKENGTFPASCAVHSDFLPSLVRYIQNEGLG